MPPERARALSCRGTRTLGRVGQRLRSHVCALHTGSGKGGRPQLSPGREVAHTGTHSGTTQWRMESPEREELGGALPAFDGRRLLIPYKRFPTPAHRARRA
jgi:hypothetical protein